MKFYLLDLDYLKKGELTKARIFGKDEKGNLCQRFFDFEPYFFVLPKETKKAKKEIENLLAKKKLTIKRIEETKRKIRGQEKTFLKIYCLFPPDTQKVRDVIKKIEKKRGGSGQVIEEYEYALSFSQMFLLANGIYESGWLEEKNKKIFPLKLDEHPKLKVLAFDLEANQENGKEEIIMISFFGRNFKKVSLVSQKGKFPSFVELFRTEKELLEDFVQTIKKEDPDIILTYNGDAFDFLLLKKRSEENKVKLSLGRDGSMPRFVRRQRGSSAKIVGRVHLDLFPFIKNILSVNLETEVLTLDAVSSELLGDRKIELTYQELLESWRKKRNIQKLILYCLKDSELTFKLFELLSPQIFELSRVAGQLLFDVCRMSYSQLVESYLSKKAYLKKEIIPNQPKFEEILKRRQFTFQGGYVKEPLGGIHQDIALIDFRSLHPSIIATFNISPETLNYLPCQKKFFVPSKNYWFCQDKKGFVSETIKDLLFERWEIKKRAKKEKDKIKKHLLDNRQKVMKIIANATYGYFGFPGSKWYCRWCAEATAAIGRDLIKKVIKEAEKSFVVVYGDTDSAFLKPKEKERKNFKERVKNFLSKINKKLPGLIELDLQGFYRRGIFIPKGLVKGTAKKRYALLDEKGNLLIRGLETVRKDWCNLAKELQRKILEFVLKKEDLKKSKRYVKETIENLKKKKIELKDLVIYEQLTKPVEEYKTTSPHLACAKKMIAKGEKVEPGTVIIFVISKKGESISEKAIPFEWAKIEDIDTNYYIEHQIIPAALRILSVFGIKREDLI